MTLDAVNTKHGFVQRKYDKQYIAVSQGNLHQSLKSKGETETLKKEPEIRLSHMQIPDVPQSTLLKQWAKVTGEKGLEFKNCFAGEVPSL